jgi:tRNA nucleotidyltransferase (CCA-adding enzyme)
MYDIYRKTISRKLFETIETLSALIKDHGARALLVGGSVRDMLIGCENVKDVDIEVFGITPEKLKEILSPHFKLDLVGLSFGVIKLHHLDIDISLPRRESKRALGHKGFDIKSDPFLSIEEAASRRDFTINAIYYDPIKNEIIDPYNGRADIQSKTLRHVSDKFVEDPLRVLRGMQFVARFDLAVAPETAEICRSMTPEDLPPERLLEEWRKLLLKGKKISRGLNFLRLTGWVKYYPELKNLIGCEQEPKWHPEGDVWNHTCHCLDAFAKKRINDDDEDFIVGLAVVCHDFGKPFTTKRINGKIRSLGHDVAGVDYTISFLKRLTNEERILKEVPPLVKHHMAPFALWKSKAKSAAIRRLALNVIRIDRLCRVSLADHEGRPPINDEAPEIEWLKGKAEELKIADCAPKPIIQGRDLINMGLKPSREFGKIIAKCFEAQIEEKFSDYPSGLNFLKEFLAKREKENPKA